MVRALLEAGAALDMQNNQGMTALMKACQKGHEQVARALLEAKADPNKATEDGRTPLMAAANFGHEQVCDTMN